MAEGSAAAGLAAASSQEKPAQSAEGLRESGNAKFKRADLAGARADYEKALALLPAAPMPDCSDKDGSAASGTAAAVARTPVLLNLALCCLRSEPPDAGMALGYCEEVLYSDPENAKATYRKAKALIELGEEKEAEWELVRACKLLPKDPAVRRDLEELRQRQRRSRQQEKATYDGLFERRPGFASEGRDQGGDGGAGDNERLTEDDLQDLYFHDDKENPFDASEQPHDEALALQAQGKLADAVLAWEAALAQSAARKDWMAHDEQSLSMGRLLMDLNVDRLALRCFARILAGHADSDGDDVQAQAEANALMAKRQQQALLLKAVCLLNEAKGDPKVEISLCLSKWVQVAQLQADQDVVSSAASAAPSGSELVKQLEELQSSGRFSADAAIALGLLDLLEGSEAVVERFAASVRATCDDSSCFGDAQHLAVRWNMLGAVLANRKRYEHAMVAYEEALRLRPHYPRALINLSIAQQARAAPREAVAALARAVSCVPTWAAEQIWPMLCQSAAADDELAEAAKSRNLIRICELLPAAVLPSDARGSGAADVSVQALLAQAGF